MQLLCWLAPAIYNEFPNIAIGDANLLHLVVSSVDARQLQELVCRVVQGKHKFSLIINMSVFLLEKI